jgi:hypothetical protein
MPSHLAATPAVYLLADNLDAALAAGEDLLAASLDVTLPPGLGGAALAERLAQRHRFFDHLRSLELTLVQRILRAREHAVDVTATDERFKLVSSLFIGGTAPLVDAVAELGAIDDLENPRTRDAVAYARAKGMIASDAAGFQGMDRLSPDENFLIAERIALGPLLDLLATFLDSLELHFDLFVAAKEQTTGPRSLAEAIAALR